MDANAWFAVQVMPTTTTKTKTTSTTTSTMSHANAWFASQCGKGGG